MPPPLVSQAQVKELPFIAKFAWFMFKLGFGLVSLATVWTTAVLKDGVLWAKDTEEEKDQLAAAQEKYWSLRRDPLPGFRHAFFTTTTGARLHYITNAEAGAPDFKNMCLFIHGFPDSFLLWRHIIQSPELQHKHILIAVDLPGYGGSDSLPSYGPDEILETMTEFILDMRRQYMQINRRVVVATHDWGALVGFRLAAEASQLADHWIITSGILPRLTTVNAAANMSLSRKMFRTYLYSPWHLGLLKNGWATFGPVRSQFRRSFYIFCFHLPKPFSNFFGMFGNYWFLRTMHSLSKGKLGKDEKLLGCLNPKEAGEAMAMSIGPGMRQLDENPEDNSSLRYGESLRKRLHDRGMSEKARIYQDGLFLGKWEKSLQTAVALFEIGAADEGTMAHQHIAALKAPATILLGERDPAFDWQLALTGIKEFLTRGSHVVMVKDAGHWLPLEPSGRRVVEKVISWALNEEAKTEREGKSTLFATMSDARVVLEM
ncbi:Alpha/Beta hydrolase protein [Ampelomyces quisqualis]|uniref:Alpha/Beta hydrolase protein n=1 Tax=Ampelomyces quisqualis TaxID=50730 RepID=A0A6A5QVZ8_AMPQU|nr:Alpha/Beta hydrolase protein [Ampelomyces quisqualis]